MTEKEAFRLAYLFQELGKLIQLQFAETNGRPMTPAEYVEASEFYITGPIFNRPGHEIAAISKAYCAVMHAANPDYKQHHKIALAINTVKQSPNRKPMMEDWAEKQMQRVGVKRALAFIELDRASRSWEKAPTKMLH